MTASEQMLALVEGSKNLRRLCREYETESVTVHLKELVGGAFSLYAAATIRRTGGVHVFVAEDRDAAAYLLNDLYALLDERRILFFPSSYKRSIVYGAEDAQGVVQRTAALNALRTPPAGYLALCTYPEALAERVVDAEALRRETMTVRAGDRLRPADLVEWLDESGFVRVDFVYEPGQYSQRGGIVDVFSYVESLPYRFDFFDEEVDSIRRFNISSQLSQDKLQQAEIIPNLNAREGGRVSLVEAAGDVCYWFFDADYALRRVDDLRRRMLAEADDPAGVDRALTSRRQLLDALAGKRLFAARDTLAERPATVAVEFRTAPQPSFNKNFELLADDLSAAMQKGYRTYILSENKAQVERLQNIFHHRLISESCRHMIFIKPVIIGPVFIISLTILSIYPRFQGRRKSSAFIEKIIVIRTERYNVFIQTQEIPIDIVLVDPHFSIVHIPYDIVLLTLDNPPVRLVFICIRITQIPIQCPCRQIVDSRKLPTIGTAAAINIFCFFLNI